MTKLLLDYAHSDPPYSDGAVEQRLLELFQKPHHQKDIQDILASSPEWPLRYHLSPERENLLNWYPFSPHGSLLEVGAGCGALTGLFCNRLTQVTAVELTKMRAEITYTRHKERDNLTVIAGNLHDIPLPSSYDYVTCIGVLEYATKFSSGERPDLSFLTLLKSYLRPGGVLILAIENRLGIKYWSGAKEDHTGRLFDSIENYPDSKGILTYSKSTLTTLLSESGFTNLSFYYPLPDYKLPHEIFSDHYLPTLQHPPRMGTFPTRDYAQSREYFFDESHAMNALITDHYFDIFSNSFLVFAS